MIAATLSPAWQLWLQRELAEAKRNRSRIWDTDCDGQDCGSCDECRRLLEGAEDDRNDDTRKY